MEYIARCKCKEMLSVLFQVLYIMWQIGLQKANVDFFLLIIKTLKKTILSIYD